ncbi:AAA family ATPase [Brevibacillus daliensis]|uniref:AAA family ATPase n=1 Tax=Brevibacillus daliensis TaxID=2892995 RepID=UPI001E48DBA9|nr:AAA family ATPase [Brevibacillus daliensis]
MIIHDIHIKGFGKWKEQHFQFAPGLNLFYAPNESGKSTLLQAVFASLFGMKKDYVKVSRYLDEYDQYFPWDHTSYETIVRYTLGSQTYRLHRVLDKEREQSILYLEPELTVANALYKEDRRRELPFIEKHLGLTRTLFTDITWIRREEIGSADYLLPQLMHKEAVDPLAGKIVSSLEAELASIGVKENAENTRFGQVNKEWKQAKQDLDQAEMAWEAVQHLTAQAAEGQKEYDRLSHEQQKAVREQTEMLAGIKEWQSWWDRMYQVKKVDDLEPWLSAESLFHEHELAFHRDTKEAWLMLTNSESAQPNKNEIIQSTDDSHPSQSDVLFLLEKDYQIAWQLQIQTEELRKQRYECQTRLIKEENNYQITRTKRDKWQAQEENRQSLKQKESELLQRMPELIHYDDSIAKKAEQALLMAASRREKTLDKVDLFVSMGSRKNKETPKRENNQRNNVITPTLVASTVSLVLLVWSIWMGLESYLTVASIGFFLAVSSGVIAILLFIRRPNRATVVEQMTDLTDDKLPTDVLSWLEEVEKSSAEEVAHMRLLGEQHAQIKQELQKLNEWFSLQQDTWSRLQESENVLKQRVEEIKQQIDQVMDQEQEQEKQIKLLCKRQEVSQFDELVEKREMHLSKIHLLESSEQERERERLIETWTEHTRDMLLSKKEEWEQYQETCAGNITQINQELMRIKEEIARAQGEIGQRDERSFAKIQSAFREADERRNEVILYREALQVARDTLQQALVECQREVSPDLNVIASEISEVLTEGRYRDVRVDPMQRFAIRAIEPERQLVMEQKRFSTGTQDQLYFTQRMAIIQKMSREREPLPVFLDDHFVHYDEQRLHKTLDYLLSCGENHQIFLFSCHKREMEYVKDACSHSSRHMIYNWETAL